jgi:multidrug resistance efflux pump
MVSVLLLMTTACTNSLLTKRDYISNYEAWIKNLKANYKEYKKPDWSTAEADFKRYSEGDYNRLKDQFSEEEREKVDNLTGQYYALLAKSKANQVKGEIKSIINKAQAMLEELKKE